MYHNIQSINQLNFHSANIPGEARLSGVTAESVFNSKIDGAVPEHQRVIRCAGVYGGKAKSKGCILKVETEMAEPTDSGRLFHSERVQEWNALAPVLVLTLLTNRRILLFDLSERNVSDTYSVSFAQIGGGGRGVLAS